MCIIVEVNVTKGLSTALSICELFIKKNLLEFPDSNLDLHYDRFCVNKKSQFTILKFLHIF